MKQGGSHLGGKRDDHPWPPHHVDGGAYRRIMSGMAPDTLDKFCQAVTGLVSVKAIPVRRE
jgi:hypothetical protein